MAIYRGAGGAGDAVADSSSEAVITIQAKNDALAAKVAAEAARDAAQLAETNAEAAETNAETAETNAETAASSALTNANNASNSAVSASNSATSASASATSAGVSATNASNSSTAAAGSASAAAISATSASNSASSASASASSASSSASSASFYASAAATNAGNAGEFAADAETYAAVASTQSSNAASSATAAQTAETNAETAASAASTSASNAATSATNASNSASAAATSATNAANSATSASTSATNASNSATTAATSASTATTKASEAVTSATNAGTAASAATSAASTANAAATTATTQAGIATTQAGIATTQAGIATTQANNSTTQAGVALVAAGNAATSASAANTSAIVATNNAIASASSASSSQAAADAALAALDSFDDRYLGQKAVAPTVDNDGNALVTGSLYFDTSSNSMKVWDGGSWLSAYASLSGALLSTNNLSDLSSTSTARTNLGLGTAAITDSTDYASATQGSLADSSVQPSDNISTLTNDSGFITGNQTITLSGDVSGSGTTSIIVTVADDSHNHIISNVDGLQTAIEGKQATLVSGTNIKTVNSTSLLGSGNLAVGTVTSVGGTGTVNGLTLTGTVTSSGNLTLGGTLSNVNLTSQVTGVLPITNGGTNGDTSGKAVMNLNNATSQANIGGTTTFTASTGRVQIFTGTLSNTIKLPDCTTTISTGWEFEIINKSTQSLPVVSFNSSSVGSIPSGCTAIITRTANTTDNTATYWAIAVITSTSGTVTSVSGTAPISVATGTTTPAISISAATISAAGSMSSADKTKLDGIATGANNYTLPTATSTIKGGIELASDTVQTVAPNAVTATASRSYGLQLNSSGQGIINVPWTDTVYTLPSATSTILGGIELGSDTVQTVEANAVTATASRSYALQLNSSGQAVVNVPWTSGGTGTVTSVATGTGLTGGTITTTGTISLASGYGDTLNPYASKTAKFVLAAPNAADGVPTFRALVASDIPTLNQNTTGSSGSCTGNAATATTLQTARTIQGVSFNGSANITVATAGTGISISGTAITNTAPNIVTSTTGSAPYYGARAWVNFNSQGVIAIRASANVSSITDNGVGDYTINFTTAMPDANYAVSGSIDYSNAGSYMILGSTTTARTASAYRFWGWGGGGLFDFPIVNIMIIR